MTYPPLFTTDPEHPSKLYLRNNIRLTTGGQYDEEDRWTRFVQGKYDHHRGFLTTDPWVRVQFMVCAIDEETLELTYLQDYPQDYIAEQLNQHMTPGTLVAIHYAPSCCVSSLLCNLPIDTEEQLPARLKYPYVW